VKKLLISIIVSLLSYLNVEAQVFHIPIENLLKDSYELIEGEVINVAPKWDEQHQFIYSFVDIKINMAHKGKVKAEIITLREFGGEIDNFATSAPLSPVYNIGDFVFVCIEVDNRTGLFSTKGFWQGKFELRAEKSGKRILFRNNADKEIIHINKEKTVESEITYENLLSIMKNLEQ